MADNDFSKKLILIQGKMFGYALRLTKNIEDANDLRQDTTLKALQIENGYTERNSFTGWIFKIMKNHYLNEYKSLTKEKAVIKELVNKDINQLYSIPSIFSDLNYKDILEYINKLDDIYKIPFLMVHNGHKYYEISEELNIPIGTVKSRISEARKQLKDMIKE